MPEHQGGGLAVGDEVEVDVTAIAHGGHCIARHEGQVLFVRHTIPGERVLARVTETGAGERFVRADAVSVVTASPDRVTPPCPWAGPGLCGGCDLQHVALHRQRALKADVVREQMARLAHLELDVEVEPVPGDADGLDWRTRVEFAVDAEGRAGLRRHRSHDVVAIDHCRIAAPGIDLLRVTEGLWPGVEVVDTVAPSVGEPLAVVVPGPVVPVVHERVDAGWSAGDGSEQSLSRDLAVSARGFWQVHPGAASTLLGRVVALMGARPGDLVADLYAGSGLFTMRLAELVAPGGSVLGVEGDARAVENGIRNTEHLEGVEWRANRVDRELRSLVGQGVRADLVVLDPPRTGAGKDVVRLVAGLEPRRIVYVACDPAALARDVRAAAEHGYSMVSLEAWDAFPMTHHVECIAVLEPTSP
jgi:tRNA/tmRNA/rRNA uracil-C5-methylase (TrmA/RlmC/RlmD family)